MVTDKRVGYTLRVYGRESQHKTLSEAHDYIDYVYGENPLGIRLYCNITRKYYQYCECPQCKTFRSGVGSYPSSELHNGSHNQKAKDA